MRRRDFPALRPGQVFRLVPHGPILRCIRVSPAAAYVRAVAARHVTVAGPVEPISLHAAVYPAEGES